MSQRKQQLAQLAEMGIAIPDEFRPDMAMAGEWQVTSERVIMPEGEKRPDAMALGVRKREPGEEDEEEVAVKKSRWGSAYRSHPTEEDDGDLNALLSNITRKGNALTPKFETKEDIKQEFTDEPGVTELSRKVEADEDEKPAIKREPADGQDPILPTFQASDDTVKEEGGETAPGIVFKKRKAKNIRQR